MGAEQRTTDPGRVVDALLALHQAATPGPWAWEATGEKDNSWALGLTEPEHVGEMAVFYGPDEDPEVVEHVASSGAAENFADARLICAMRYALPALLDVVEAARERVRKDSFKIDKLRNALEALGRLELGK